MHWLFRFLVWVLGLSNSRVFVSRVRNALRLTQHSAGSRKAFLRELHALAKQHPNDVWLQKAVRDMASVIVNKCTDGTRVRMGAQPHQLAAVAEVVE